MKKSFKAIRDIFISGLIFLLPIVLLIVLLTKVFIFLTGYTSKMASVFGLKSFVGISGGTIISTLSIFLLCILCGYMVRIAIFKSISTWIDKKMIANIPGYAVYHEMALSKLKDKEEILPYQSAAWVNANNMRKPAFLMDTMPDGKKVIFIPAAGNPKEGIICVLDADKVIVDNNIDMKAFKLAINNLGLGLATASQKPATIE